LQKAQKAQSTDIYWSIKLSAPEAMPYFFRQFGLTRIPLNSTLCLLYGSLTARSDSFS
jgi:hypothetical protein